MQMEWTQRVAFCKLPVTMFIYYQSCTVNLYKIKENDFSILLIFIPDKC